MWLDILVCLEDQRYGSGRKNASTSLSKQLNSRLLWRREYLARRWHFHINSRKPDKDACGSCCRTLSPPAVSIICGVFALMSISYHLRENHDPLTQSNVRVAGVLQKRYLPNCYRGDGDSHSHLVKAIPRLLTD